MKTVKVYTNVVLHGWSPKDLETGIGGSEEKLIEWAKALAKDYDITIYMNGENGDFDGVKYRPHDEFKAWDKHDVFISFKASHILDQSINADKIIHWTTEVEPEWPKYLLNSVDEVLTISEYHTRRMGSQGDKIHHEYLWADFERLDKHKVKREPNTMLYSSSFDRGLEELLARWPVVKEELGLEKLYVTYGWEFLNRMVKTNPRLAEWKVRIEKLLDQEGVEMLGQLSNDEMCKMYWKSQYWCLPLNKPDSELFCINAVKAQYCGAKPVVRRIGALQETVADFIDWDELVGQKTGKSHVDNGRQHVTQFSMDKAIKRWHKILG